MYGGYPSLEEEGIITHDLPFGALNKNFEKIGNIVIHMLLNEHKGAIHFYQERNQVKMLILAEMPSNPLH